MAFGFPDKIEDKDILFISCNEGWETIPAPEFVSVAKTVTTINEYNGIGGQISRSVQTTRGPAVEVNNQFFADDYAFCARAYGYGCNSGGSCKFRGLNDIIQGTVTTEYTYSETSGELVKRETVSRNTKLSAAQPFDWRSSIENGLPTDFKSEYAEDAFLAELYVAQIVTAEYYIENGLNVEFTTTLVSPTSRGVGINAGDINAGGPDGIKSTTKRFSTTTSTREQRPDTTKSLTVNTIEQKTLVVLNENSYEGPDVAGPYVEERQVPIPIILNTEEEVSEAVSEYSQYLKKFIKGDFYGMQVAESLRSEICTGWAPGMAFRLADPQSDVISAMRMDACSWGVTQEESIVVTNGIWTGTSSGTLSVQSNLEGNSTPSLAGGAPTPAPGAGAPPTVSDDVVYQSYEFNISAAMSLDGGVFNPGGGQVPADLTEDERTSDIEMCTIVYCSGSTVGPGDLLGISGIGSLPTDSNGQLIVQGATVVDNDLFSDV